MMSYNEIKKYTSNLADIKYQCKRCGRKEVIGVNDDKKLCTHCGHYIFKSDADEFKYRMKEGLKNEKNKIRSY